MKTIILVEIVCKGSTNPRNCSDLADLLYGIDDGQVDGSVDIVSVRDCEG